MGSGSDLESFDSVGADSDYTTMTNVVFASAMLKATDDLSVHLDGSFALSEGSFDPFELSEPEEAPSNWDGDYSGISAYSDLEYSQLEATLGADYAVSSHTKLTGAVTLMDLQDDQPYVYGDVGGTLLLYSLGMRWDF